MILNPEGTPWQMPQNLLDRSPFDSYLIPGIILLIANGALSLSSLIAVVRRDPGYGWWVVLQGVVLAVWLVVEIAMIRHLWVGYFVFGGIAILLIVSGILLKPARKAA
jgi:hypothetical protein